MYLLGAALVEKLCGLPQLCTADDGVVNEKKTLVADQASTGISFMRAIRFLWFWLVGMKERARLAYI